MLLQMFEDVTLKKVRATEVGQPFGKGSFGSIYKVQLASVSCLDENITNAVKMYNIIVQYVAYFKRSLLCCFRIQTQLLL